MYTYLQKKKHFSSQDKTIIKISLWPLVFGQVFRQNRLQLNFLVTISMYIIPINQGF